MFWAFFEEGERGLKNPHKIKYMFLIVEIYENIEFKNISYLFWWRKNNFQNIWMDKQSC